MQHSHIAAAPQIAHGGETASSSDPKRGKKRGSYNCGRCGLPKKGHNCNIKTPESATTTPCDSSLSVVSAPSSAVSGLRQPPSSLRRALSFDEFDESAGGVDPVGLDDRADGDLFAETNTDLDPDLDLDGASCGLPVSLLWEVLRRLPPPGLLSAAKVCKGWRNTAKKLWRAAEELKLRVPTNVHVGFVASMLQKCPGIVRLSLRMERCVCKSMLLRSKLHDLQFEFEFE